MNIALDYDGTFTTDPHFWLGFIYSARAAGHVVHIVTMRYESEPITAFTGNCLTWYTGRKAKKAWCEKEGLEFDIWIDDRPEWLCADSA